ncbi:MAG TPA: FIST N-terminal domain-containing protein [Longimicrobiaceae bacterium]|nr:FIST N-terminal domain-containing protein [Longimicrobiaceae bacterium]
MTPSSRASSAILLDTFDEDRLVDAVERCRSELGGRTSIAFAFCSSDWAPHLIEVSEIVQVYGRSPHVVGCSTDGLIGSGEEDEDVSGISLLFLDLPETEIFVAGIERGREDMGDWEALTGLARSACGGWIALLNPATFDGESWLRSWNRAYPGIPTYGGLAGGRHPDTGFTLFHNGSVNATDALVIGLSGRFALDGLVSQGCRPIGEPYTITEVDDNVVLGIASKRAYEMLEETFRALAPEDRRRAQGNIFAGLATRECVDEFKRGDFLVRNIIGGDPDVGALALGAHPHVGQTLQFQLRDRDAADEDLRALATATRDRLSRHSQIAALLFSCAGRGHRLFGVPDHDAGVLDEAFGPLPLAGFFCNGEIGPVGPETFLHGYTASAAFFIDTRGPEQE